MQIRSIPAGQFSGDGDKWIEQPGVCRRGEEDGAPIWCDAHSRIGHIWHVKRGWKDRQPLGLRSATVGIESI
ncbi:hypothetical protein GCM10023074_19860 [Microbispora amethystogenes]